MGIFGYAWVCIGIYWNSWVFMEIYGYVQVYMGKNTGFFEYSMDFLAYAYRYI